MSETAPKGIYVYQPYGSATHPDRARTGRLFGLGGLPFDVECKGLTREEADAFAEALNEICWMADRCSACGHRFRFSSTYCPQCGDNAVPPWEEPELWPERCDCDHCVAARERKD
jgi:hypothetical protein